ncbi:DMT family transporter [Candidatus Pelagibacter sp.]|nr:DMT family transporter [Candidatus Pelagibacter sp.]
MIVLVMFFLGSAYPLGKFGLNASMNPIFFGALRMGFVFLCLLPFCKIIIPKKKYLLPLIGFSLCMGAGVNMFLYLSINTVTLLAPITIGAQLSIPFAILISSLFLKESISLKKWIFIFLSFLGIILIAFDPDTLKEISGTLLVFGMAFFYGLSQVFSRYIKDLDVKFTNSFMGFVGFVVLIIFSQIFEGNIVDQIKNVETIGWFAVMYAGMIISILGHMMMFYLYKFYPVGMVMPFYSLFPVFGLILTFLVFGEVPSLITMFGGIIVITSIYLLQKIR